jgi:hypothetical protein
MKLKLGDKGRDPRKGEENEERRKQRRGGPWYWVAIAAILVLGYVPWFQLLYRLAKPYMSSPAVFWYTMEIAGRLCVCVGYLVAAAVAALLAYVIRNHAARRGRRHPWAWGMIGVLLWLVVALGLSWPVAVGCSKALAGFLEELGA